MTPQTLKRAKELTEQIEYIDGQIESVRDATKVKRMGLNYAAFEVPHPKGSKRTRARMYDSHETHHESVNLEDLPHKTQQELFLTVSKAVVSKLTYRRRVARKELASL
ncbi:hypothetical protein KA005_42515 [bacterium]|nr:hypothetical protein [bacterium]